MCDSMLVNTHVLGCKYPIYLEYAAGATVDDGSCSTMIVYGFMDDIACNYDL